MDPRVQKLAKLLIHYSLKLKSGQLIKITGEPVTLPLLLAAYEEAVKVGAHPLLELRPPEADEILLKHGSDKQLQFVSPMGKVEINRLDAYLMVWGSKNTKYLSGVDPKRQALRQQSRRPYMMRFFKRTAEGSLKWVGTQFPTEADAQDAGMSLSDYEDFVYRAGHLHSADPVKHWQKVAKQQRRLVRLLNKLDHLHVQAPDTDLHLRVKGRKWISCHGDQNFP
ncbi:MAG: aminopeptidase, partial [Candidatus Zixiibacteriota bacterium]